MDLLSTGQRGNSVIERAIPSDLTIVLCGTGPLFKGRESAVKAFRSVGAEVRVYATSAESVDLDAPRIIREDQIRDIVAHADLTLLMLADPQERGPSVERLELSILQRAEHAMGAFGFGCSSSGFEVIPEQGCVVAQTLKRMGTKVAFGFAPQEMHHQMRQDAKRGMRLFPSQQWEDAEIMGRHVLTMLEYVRT